MDYVTRGGVRLAFVEAGHGPKSMLLVHGMLQHAFIGRDVVAKLLEGIRHVHDKLEISRIVMNAGYFGGCNTNGTCIGTDLR